MQALLPAVGGLGMIMFIVANGNPIFLLAGVSMLVATIGGGIAMFVMSKTGARKAHTQARRNYLEYLERVRDDMRTHTRNVREYNRQTHHEPARLASWVQGTRVYERRRQDPDFGQARVGVGATPHPISVQLPQPRDPMESQDPVCLRAMSNIASTYRWISGQPLTVPCGTSSSVAVRSQRRGEAIAAVRAIIMQLLANHSPDDLHLVVISKRVEQDFAFLRWAPHAQDPHRRHGVVPRSWLVRTREEFDDELHDFLLARLDEHGKIERASAAARPRSRMVVLIDEWDTGPTGELTLPDSSVSPAELGICTMRLLSRSENEPTDLETRVVVEGPDVTVTDLSSDLTVRGKADRPSDADATALTKALAPLVVQDDVAPEEQLAAETSLKSALGIEDVGLWEKESGWAPRSRRDFLRAGIGTRADGRPLVIDIKESAHDGIGPHGLVVGATGSGKSELLRSIVLSLAMHHSPEDLAFVLVDFKGGATFAGLEKSPHVAGMITNLADDLSLVDRMHDALFGEINRRQQVLYDAGNLPNLFAYHEARKRNPELEPLPALMLIVDEFAELLTARPDFIDLFTAVGRIGRSIGVHQLLASQRLDDGQLRGLESFLSYRLALRTFNAEESRAVIGVPDAFELPAIPGSGYLKVDTTYFERFKAAYVSGPYRPASTTPVKAPRRIQPVHVINPKEEPVKKVVETNTALDDLSEAHRDTVLDVAVSLMADAAPATRQIWLDPLPDKMSLSDVNTRLANSPAQEPLTARIGVVDIPSQQRQAPLDVDLRTSHAHFAVVGGPQSGISTTLRTIAHAFAAHHTPRELTIHAVDFTGGLRSLREVPNVGSVANRLDMSLVGRVFAELVAEVDRREALFSEAGISSMDEFRTRHAAGEFPSLLAADVLLIIDGYPTLKTDYDELHDQLTALVTRGAAYGIHTAMTAARWHDLRPALQTAVPGRIELRLNDGADSVFDRKLATNLPAGVPGRCLVGEGRVAHISLPVSAPIEHLDGVDVVEAERTAVAALSDEAAERAEKIRTLPNRLTFDEVRAVADTAALEINHDEYKPLQPVILGQAEDTMRAVTLDLGGADGNLLIFGDQGSGKTAVLKLIVQQLIAAHTDDEVVIAAVDPRRQLLGVIPDDYLGAYAPNVEAASGLAQSLAGELDRRQPNSTDPAQLVNHRWDGPRIVLLVDDAELVTGSSMGGALDPLVPKLAAARDLGFHVVSARHAGGAGRSLFEPFYQRLKEFGSPGLLLSGDPEEGMLWPKTRLVPQPPGRAQFVRRGQRPRLMQVALPPGQDKS